MYFGIIFVRNKNIEFNTKTCVTSNLNNIESVSITVAFIKERLRHTTEPNPIRVCKSRND